MENGKWKIIFQDGVGGGELDHKCFKAGMRKYFRVPVGTGSPKPRHAEGCSFDLTVEIRITPPASV